MLATDLGFKQPFDYRKFHEEVKSEIFARITHNGHAQNPKSSPPTDILVKKVLYGALYPKAIKAVCDSYGMSVRGKRIEFSEFSNFYSNAIIATDLPGYELIIYLRSRQKKEYLKMVQVKDGHFKYERPTPSRVGFFLWLESLQPTLGTRITLSVLEAFTKKETKTK